jgi:hypothetical protein
MAMTDKNRIMIYGPKDDVRRRSDGRQTS